MGVRKAQDAPTATAIKKGSALTPIDTAILTEMGAIIKAVAALLIISESDILATTSKGIVVSNKDVINHLATLKNKTQTRDQKILARQIYDQQQVK